MRKNRLTTFATTAWAPGSTDGTRNDNPIWVTPAGNTTIYVKYDGNLLSGGSVSPLGLHYDVSYPVNALNHKRLRDPNDNDQSGLAVFTCDGTKLAAVYGEDASTATAANPSWDVGSTIRPFCALKLIFANDDYAFTLTDNPVTIPILKNDYGFNAVVDPASVNTTGLLQPRHGTVTINSNGTVLYTPDPGYQGLDTFEYSVCSTPSPIVCDKATVYVKITSCPAPANRNLISGHVFLDKNKDGLNDDGGSAFSPATVYLYIDGNCNGTIDANELSDSVVVDNSGTYQFITYPEKTIADNFDGPNGTGSCASGSDGNTAWASNWVDAGDPSTGFCVSPAQTIANTKAEIVKDGAFSYALRLKGANVSATRTVNLSGATYAFLTFSYRRASTTLAANENIIVQASTNGSSFSTIYTIDGDGTKDNSYVTIYNQDISAYAAATTYIRFLTNANVDDADSVFIDNISIKYLKYPQCYITKLSPASVPSDYYMTTSTQKAFSVSGSGSCFAPYDFGVAKSSITISGTLFNDANGLVDNTVNGTVTGSPSGTTMYAYLTDNTGKVAFKTTVNAANGTFLFPVADATTTYNLILSSSDSTVNHYAPAQANLPSTWVSVGENYGLNNAAGVGNKTGISTSSVPVITGVTSITGINLGIERLPDSDNKNQFYGFNTPGVLYTIPTLSGSDAEDGIAGLGKKYKIISLPAGAVLYYNGLPVSPGQIISNYNDVLFKVDPNDNTITTYFDYALIDAASLQDPTPARVTLTWSGVLATESLVLAGSSRGKDNYLTWTTDIEINTDHFELQQSSNGTSFVTLTTAAAKGNSPLQSSYSFVHHDPASQTNYYRVKLYKTDGQFKFSNSILLKSETQSPPISVAPNPFTSNVTATMYFNNAGLATISIYDEKGNLVKQISRSNTKGVNIFYVNNLDGLAAGTYIIQIKNEEQIAFSKIVKVK